MELRFHDPQLKVLCCRQTDMQQAVGRPEAEAIAQLLNELVCADDLDLLDQLPHIHLEAEEDDHVIEITGIGQAGVRLHLDEPGATTGVVLAISCGDCQLGRSQR